MSDDSEEESEEYLDSDDQKAMARLARRALGMEE